GLSDCLDGKLVYNHWMKKNPFWTESLLSSLSLSYLLPPLLLFSLLLPCFPLSTFHALSLSSYCSLSLSPSPAPPSLSLSFFFFLSFSLSLSLSLSLPPSLSLSLSF